MKKDLSADLTSYDLLKSLALLLMLVDHAGMFFFPDENALRLVGRMSGPIWLFLIGYARSRRPLLPLLIGGGLIQLGWQVVQPGVWLADILFAMFFIRLILDDMMEKMLENRAFFFLITFILLVLTIPSYGAFMYGTPGIMFAVFGYLVRRRNERAEITPTLIAMFGGVLALDYVVISSYSFGFDTFQAQALLSGVSFMLLGLYFFGAGGYPGLTARLPAPAAAALRLMGRRTLIFYVAHLLILMGIAASLGVDGFSFHFPIAF